MYKPGQFLTIIEQLLPCRARCKFIQFVISKPDKFGIKFWVLVCLKTKYICNIFPYLGKDPNLPLEKGQLQGEQVVMRLLEPFVKKGYNTTNDNLTR